MCDVFLCFCHFPIWCPGSGGLIVSISDLLPFSLLSKLDFKKKKTYCPLLPSCTRSINDRHMQETLSIMIRLSAD